MTKEEITIPRWLLERIEDTLRIQYNINLDKKTGETCQDRNIKESLNGVRKLLRGEELTGGERLERLQPSLSSNLDEAAEEYGKKNTFCPDEWTSTKELSYLFSKAFKAGAEWMVGQGYTKEETVYFERLCDENRIMVDLGWGEPERGGFNPGDKVVVQIRKK